MKGFSKATQNRQKKILIIKNRAIGDTVLMTGPLRLLHEHFPRHQIHVLVRSPAGELLEGIPFITRVISSNEPKEKFRRFAYWMSHLRKLREQSFDYVLNFHASFRTSLFGKFVRAETIVANHHELKGRNWFSDKPVPGRGLVKSIIDRDLDVLRAIGIQAKVEDALPMLKLSEPELKAVKKLLNSRLESQSLQLLDRKIFLGVGASRETKRYPVPKFMELIKRLSKDKPSVFIVTTINSDKKWMSEFNSFLQQEPEIKKRVVHFENLSLRQVACIISQCTGYVGNDSGLKHVAAALSLPTFTFFGPEAPLEWHPYTKISHQYLYEDGLECRTETGKHWCPIEVCKKHGHRCLNDLDVNEAFKAISGIFKNAH